jgi:hypothetical protein
MDSLRLLAHPSELRDDYASALASVWRDGLALELVSRELQSCRSIVLTAVRQNGLALEYASPEMRDDEAVVLAAIRTSSSAVHIASRRLARSPRFLLKAIRRNPEVASFTFRDRCMFRELALRDPSILALDHPWSDDAVLLLDVIHYTAEALRFLPALRDNRDFVRSAVELNGLALLYAPKFQNDYEVAALAASSDPRAIGTVSPELLANRDFMRKVVSSNGLALLYAEQSDDRELLLLAMAKDPVALHYSLTLRSDRDFILEAVRANGLVLEHLSAVFRSDREVVVLAVRQCGLALRFSLIFSDDVLDEALTQTWRCLYAVPVTRRARAHEFIERVHWSSLPESLNTELAIKLASGRRVMTVTPGERFLSVQDVSRMLRRTEQMFASSRLRFLDGPCLLPPDALALRRRSDCICLPRRRLTLTVVLEPPRARAKRCWSC